MARLNYYRFPENTPVQILIENEMTIHLKNGGEVWRTTYEAYLMHVDEVDFIEDTIGGLTVTGVKNLIKQYGGCGWTEHCERDGGCFEVTPIELKGNNSRFKYNHHL